MEVSVIRIVNKWLKECEIKLGWINEFDVLINKYLKESMIDVD